MSLLRPLIVCLVLSPVSLYAQAPTAAPVSRTCTIQRDLPTAGEKALAKEDAEAALAFYRDAVTKTPENEEARFGLVRALISKDQTTEAAREAADFVTKRPQSSLALVAAGEAAFRNADFDTSSRDALAATKMNSCDARAMELLADLFDVTAHFATSAHLLNTAHRIRPNDELLLRDWIDSLPRKQRTEELKKYLEGAPSLSPRLHEAYVSEEDHLKDRKPGECSVLTKSDTTKIPFAAIHSDASHVVAFGLDVSINGKKRRMQIDTGASGIVLTPGAAKRLGLTPEMKLQTGGVGDDGDIESYLSHVQNIQIGEVQFSNCMVEVLTKDKVDDGIDGLIGLDVFSRWLATLDYPNRQLVLAPLPPRPGEVSRSYTHPADAATQLADEDDIPRDAILPAGMTDWMRIIRIGHDILLPSSLNKGTLRYMVMDTGAADTTLSLSFAKATGKAHRDTNVEFRGLSGKVKEVYRLDDAALQFGNTLVPPESLYAFDFTNISHDTGAEVSGLVGLPTLSRLTISVDYRDNLMLMKYDPHHDPANYVGLVPR